MKENPRSTSDIDVKNLEKHYWCDLGNELKLLLALDMNVGAELMLHVLS